jgi:hypothetical protein
MVETKSTTQFKQESISTTTRVEQPVLEKVETIKEKDVFEQAHIHEKYVQDQIEIHEKPVEKVVQHPTQEINIQEKTLYQEEGRESALLERERMLEQMRLQDQQREVKFTETQDVTLHQQEPTIRQREEIQKEVITKPVVTEIHRQPIKEVHQQEIYKTVYEKPIVKVIRDEKVVEHVETTTDKIVEGVSRLDIDKDEGTTYTRGFANMTSTGAFNSATRSAPSTQYTKIEKIEKKEITK